MRIAFLEAPCSVQLALLQHPIDLTEISCRRNINGVQMPSPYAELDFHALVGSPFLLKSLPVCLEQWGVGFEKQHVSGVPRSLDHLFKFEDALLVRRDRLYNI